MPTLTTCDDRRPFLSAPNPKRYFAAAASEEARRRIVRSVARQEGPALVIGAVGVGKSLLLAVLAEQFASRMAVVTLAGSQLCTRRALLQVILYELGLSYRGLDEGELRLTLLRHLRGGAAAGGDAGASAKPQTAARRLLLLVDEADSLPARLLEELRALTNIAVDGVPLVSLVLAGSPILEERFADPQLEAFSQRIAARAYLAPMGRDETFHYVRSQVAAVGLKPEKLFAPDALEAIYAATGGLPRLVNQLGDQATWMAEETGCVPLDGALVQQAWSELQQLPAPWNTEAAAAPSTGASGVDLVEFGELDSGDEHDVFANRAKLSAMPEADDHDDDLPASIPISTALGESARGSVMDVVEFSDELTELDDLEPTRIEPPAPPVAMNPFDEDFGEEEVLVDRYFAFETLMLRKAPQVRNRMDPHLALELGRCGVAATGSVSGKASKPAEAAPAALLLVEDDDAPAGDVIPGKQFRRLFTRLASTGALA